MNNHNTRKEAWKDIKGYEGLYQVSSLGRIWSAKRSIIMKSKDTKDYLMVGLTKNGKQRWLSVHRLVAIAFIENPDNKPQINHLDEDAFNNSVANLQWVTSKENVNWGTRTARMTKTLIDKNVPLNRRVIQICKETNNVVNEFRHAAEASRETSTYPDGIYNCLKGKQKTANGYRWEYKYI